MSSDADLSTDDLAGGVQRQERAGTEAVQARGDGSPDERTMPGRNAAEGQSAGRDTDTHQTEGPGQADTTEEAAPSSTGGGDDADMALLDPADGERFRQRWNDVQARFVDDPQEAVQTADGLVAELMQSLARGFSDHKGRLESAWQSGGHPDTEELRQALRRYRSFFDRLLST